MVEEFLKNTILFNNVEDNIIKELSHSLVEKEFKKHDIIINKGDMTTDMYLILDGKVNITTFSDEGHEFIITTLQKGDIFGELSLIDGQPRSMSVEAITDVKAAILRRKIFLNLLSKHPKLCFNLLQNLSKRIRETDKKLEEFLFLDVKNRIIKFLIDNAEDKQNNIYVAKKFTHSEIAKRIGSSREAVSKAMKNLLDKGILEEKNNFIYVKNEDI